jgi:uncharacterized protein
VKFSPSSNPEHVSVLLATESTRGKGTLRTDDDLLAQLKQLPDEMDFDYFDGDSNSLLYFLARHNLVKSVSYLLEVRKVDPNLTVSDGLTAAHIAAYYGHWEVLTLLVADGRTQLDIQDNFEETALYRAVGHAPVETLVETVSILVSKMTPQALAIKNEDGYEPLRVAFSKGAHEVVKLLLNAGCCVSMDCFLSAHFFVSRMSDEAEESTLRKGSVFSSESKECLVSANLIMDTFQSQDGGTLIIENRGTGCTP